MAARRWARLRDEDSRSPSRQAPHLGRGDRHPALRGRPQALQTTRMSFREPGLTGSGEGAIPFYFIEVGGILLEVNSTEDTGL
jgi:hypothetical protein